MLRMTLSEEYDHNAAHKKAEPPEGDPAIGGDFRCT